jgi:hypothetical protein
MRCNSKKGIANFVVASAVADDLNQCFYQLTKELPKFSPKSFNYPGNGKKFIAFALLFSIATASVFLYPCQHKSQKIQNIVVQSENYIYRYDFISKIKEIVSMLTYSRIYGDCSSSQIQYVQ